MNLEELKKELYELCELSGTEKTAINHLIDYYRKSHGWSEKKAVCYCITLFNNGTIGEIKVIFGEG